MNKRVLIIGGGQAGGMVAIYLRQKKFEGSIMIISEEDHLPYQRPPLSKTFLFDQMEADKLYLKSEDYFVKNEIKIEKNTRVIEINSEKKSVLTDDKATHSYDFLVLATGSKLNNLSFSNYEDVFYLKTISDSLKIKEKMNTASSITIIGGGYIGLEVASAFAKNNISVTILESEERLMSRTASKEISVFFENKHRKMNVDIKFNSLVRDVKNNKKPIVICQDGTEYLSDLVFAGIGVKPNVELAKNIDLVCNDGIVVNNFGETSIKDIFAVGDCTNHPNEILNQNIRLESVHNAIEQSKTVALKIVGVDKPYNEVPYFWSDQYNLKLKIAGLITKNNLQRFIMQDNEGITVLHTDIDKIVCVETINRQKDFMIGRRLIEAKKNIPSRLRIKNFSSLKEAIN